MVELNGETSKSLKMAHAVVNEYPVDSSTSSQIRSSTKRKEKGRTTIATTKTKTTPAKQRTRE
jgi:hypothetical protein